jgi:hypothetical protein
MDLDTKEIKKTMRKFIALTILLVSTICSAQVQYCGSDSSQRTLVNLALRSEEIDNAAWTATDATVTANATIAPDGTTTAEKLVETATTAVHRVFNATPYSLANNSYRFAVSLKSSERTWGALRVYYNSTFYDTYVNLSTCTIGTNAAGSTATATLQANGWCRVEVVRATGGAYADGYIIPFATTADNTNSYLGVLTNGIFIWGASVQLASSPSTYIRTTDTQVTAGLANTTAKVTLSNLALRSEEFDNAAWTKTRSTVAANSIAAPDGTMTADSLIEDGTAASEHITHRAIAGILTATPYTTTIYAKAGTRSWLSIYTGGMTATFNTYYNLTDCTVGTVSANATASAQSVGNGWCRLVLNTISNSTTATPYFYLATGNNGVTYTGDSASLAYIWGAQFHPTNAPRDYLATTTAAATLGPLCPAGTTQSVNDPSRCFAVTDNRIRKW